jgi:hypothetical protein
MKAIVPLMCGVVLVGLLRGYTATPQEKAPPPVFFVTGSGWQSCGDWNRSEREFKLGYVIGHQEASTQISHILGDVPSARQVKESFDWPEGLRVGDYEKSLDKFCGDPYNTRIALANAFGFVNSTLAGSPPPDDKILAYLRCVGAAGTDADRIRECNKRQ